MSIHTLYTYTAERRDVLGCTSPTTKRFPEAREMSRGRSPRDISRAEGNLEVGGDVQPNSSQFEAVYGHSLIINPSLGMYQEIHPCRVSSIDSVKINISLPMMNECQILVHSVYSQPAIAVGDVSHFLQTGQIHLVSFAESR